MIIINKNTKPTFGPLKKIVEFFILLFGGPPRRSIGVVA